MIKPYKDWVIDADDSQYKVGELRKRNNKETGEEEEYGAFDSYFSTLGASIRYILKTEEKRIIKSKELELKQAVKEIRELQERFKAILEDVLNGA